MVQFGGHAWPGFPDYANGTPDMHASAQIWEFYEGVMQAGSTSSSGSAKPLVANSGRATGTVGNSSRADLLL